MYKTGGYWTDDNSEGDHCYKVIPLNIVHDQRQMTLDGFDIVYHTLGKLGYFFRDAGHNTEYVIISLSKAIGKKHLKLLEDAFSIEEDDGTELGFA